MKTIETLIEEWKEMIENKLERDEDGDVAGLLGIVPKRTCYEIRRKLSTARIMLKDEKRKLQDVKNYRELIEAATQYWELFYGGAEFYFHPNDSDAKDEANSEANYYNHRPQEFIDHWKDIRHDFEISDVFAEAFGFKKRNKKVVKKDLESTLEFFKKVETGTLYMWTPQNKADLFERMYDAAYAAGLSDKETNRYMKKINEELKRCIKLVNWWDKE
jgi:hypothetical protein